MKEKNTLKIKKNTFFPSKPELLNRGSSVGSPGLLTFLKCSTELWPLLYGEQNCRGVNALVVPEFGRCSWTTDTTVASTVPV